MIKYNNNTINDWNFDASNIIKVYRNNAIVFYKASGESPTPEYKVCFAVVDDITQYQETEFDDVFDNATEKWYKLNNLNQYEEYGVYGSGRSVTTYNGKLTIDDGYEYEWNGSSWVNLGEVTGSTATLPDVPFTVNYNAKNYDASTQTFAKTEGQLANTDVTITGGTLTVHDGYVTVSSSSMGVISGYGTYFNRTDSTPNLTIISKQRTDGYNCHMFANRSSKYNWMYRPYYNHLTLHGSSEQGEVAVTTQPVIESVRVDSNRLVTYNNYTDNTSSSTSSFSYGSTNGDVALFNGYTTNSTEQFIGDFYWIYMSQNTLTDEQVQQVINYNEGDGGSSEYPIYYTEKSDPLDNLTFNTMAEAQTYAYNNCVYDGMKATIDGDRYYFDSSDENGWVKILEYYYVEDVTPNAASGWTISGSSTYNPDSSYYDDFDLETNWESQSYKIAKVTIYGYDHFTYYLRSDNQLLSTYAYVMATNVDELSTAPTSMSYNSASAISTTYFFTKTAGSAVNLNNYRRITYNNLDKTVEHTFYVVFYGASFSTYKSNATILIPKEQTNENWEQVTFSASSNVASAQKNLYIDNSNLNNGGTQYWYYRWIVGLPSGSHSSYTNYSNYDYCQNVTSSTFTSVAGEQRQVNFTYDNTVDKSLSFRLTDGSNVLTPSETIYYSMAFYSPCNVATSSSNLTFPRSLTVKVGGSFYFSNSSNRHYIYGYEAPTLGTRYYSDDYQGTFDIVYTKLNDEAVTITYTTYDPNDSETPAFKTDITYPYNGGTTSSTTLTSFDVPYTYPYEVSQTNDKFSADSQSFTAGQAARTISFTLYPNNREFATVADLEAYGYAWEGMTAYVGSDKYVYQNGEWVYNPSRLPRGYTEVEYVENQNNAYINTLFKPNQDTRIIAEMQCVTSTNSVMHFGAGGWDRVDGMWLTYETGINGTLHVAWLGKTTWSTYGKGDYNKHTYDWNKNVLYKDETLVGSSTYGTYQSQNNLAIFANLQGEGNEYVGNLFMKGKMYSFKIYDNGTLVRDLVPCINPNNVVGVYDIVNDVFYGSASSYPLVAGNPI